VLEAATEEAIVAFVVAVIEQLCFELAKD